MLYLLMLTDVGFFEKKKKIKKKSQHHNSAFLFFKNFLFRCVLKLTVLIKSYN